MLDLKNGNQKRTSRLFFRKASTWILLSLGLVFADSASIASAWAETASPRLVVHLLDYLAKDYGGAVQNGKILSDSEYHEQLEFSQTVGNTESQLKYPSSARPREVAQVHASIVKLQKMIRAKADPSQVTAEAHAIRTEVIRLTGMQTTPPATPDLARGKAVFAEQCASCHGAQGYGNGSAAASLSPKPINFHDPKVMAVLSPLQIFDAVKLGVQGTAMGPHPNLSDQDIWNVSYFALSFSRGDGGSTGPRGGGSGPLSIARRKLRNAAADYRAGKFNAAQDQALAAYLEGFEPLEPKLRATDPTFVSRIETVMMRVREAIKDRRSADEVSAVTADALKHLDEVATRLHGTRMSPGMAFSAAAAILLREGFEAFLVVLAFLGVVRTSGNKQAERWLHGGWIVALACGVVAWIFSGWLIGISGAQREAMEAITAFLAAGILLFVGFWLHQKTEISRWKAFVETQVKAALEQKSLLGLASISFIAVFRETLETVLFLRAIWVDCGPSARTALMSGVICSFAVTLALAWMVLRFSRRLPIRQIFTASSLLMAGLAVILVGNGVHSLQETGTVGIATFPIRLHWELFGIFPTWQTVLSQAAILGLIALLWTMGQRASRPVRKEAARSL